MIKKLTNKTFAWAASLLLALGLFMPFASVSVHALDYTGNLLSRKDVIATDVLDLMFAKITQDIPTWKNDYYYRVTYANSAAYGIELWSKSITTFYAKLAVGSSSVVASWGAVNTASGVVKAYIYSRAGVFSHISTYPWTGPRVITLQATALTYYSNFLKVDVRNSNNLVVASGVNAALFGEKLSPNFAADLSFTPGPELSNDALFSMFKYAWQEYPAELDAANNTPDAYNYVLLYNSFKGEYLVMLAAKKQTLYPFPIQAIDTEGDGFIDNLSLTFGNGSKIQTERFYFSASDYSFFERNFSTDNAFSFTESNEWQVVYTDFDVLFTNEMTLETSINDASILSRIGVRRLPAEVISDLINYDNPDAQLGHMNDGYSEGALLGILTRVQEKKLDWYDMDYQIYEFEGRIFVRLYNKGSAVYKGILDKFGHVVSWELHYTYVPGFASAYYVIDNVEGVDGYKLISNGSLSESFVSFVDTVKSPLKYTNIECKTVSLSGVETTVPCIEYGATVIPEGIYVYMQDLNDNWQTKLLFGINRLLTFLANGLLGLVGYFFDFLFSLPIISNFVEAYKLVDWSPLLSSFSSIGSSISSLPTTIDNVLGFLPMELRALIGAGVGVSIALIAYKLYRMIRGLFI